MGPYWLDYGARMYDPSLARWSAIDPMAESYLSQSTYHFSGNNPVRFLDENGMNYNPIYDYGGGFLGTDEFGLQGEAIVMNQGDFIQGMSHSDAMSNGFLANDLADVFAGIPFMSPLSMLYGVGIELHRNSLESRPDYDGVVTDMEAREHWSGKTGGTLYVDINKLDLSPLTTKSFDGNKPLRYNFFTSFGSDTRTARVHGTLTMRLKNSTTGEVGFFRDDNGFLDTYDFNSDGRLIRDITTWVAREFFVGKGKGFGFKPYGSNPTVPVK